MNVGQGSSDNKIGGTSISFQVVHESGGLLKALKCLEDINLRHIESTPNGDGGYKIYVETDVNSEDKLMLNVIKRLKEAVTDEVLVFTSGDDDQNIPWFPRHISDLDRFANQILSYGAELDADHPGFTDLEYRKRRRQCADIAYNYKYGQPIPDIEYTAEEKATWKTVYEKLVQLFPTHACKEFNNIFPLLEEHCGFGADNIPQLQQISNFLQRTTGFSLRPVAGLLSPRDFLAGLAFRVFHSTQYIRHPSLPLYTPEPDVCHELIGHVPLFADPKFAEFSQLIGLISLGTSDEDVKRLATLYWFTVEFGLCKEDGKLRIFGAGILSSFGETEYSLSDEATHAPFEPNIVCETEYPITRYQPKYFVTESFEDASKKLIEWGKTLKKPVDVRYNPYTKGIEVLDSLELSSNLTNEMALQLDNLRTAINRLKHNGR